MSKEWNKEDSEEDWTYPQWVEELKQGSDPHIWANVCVRGETFKAESETAYCGSLNGMRLRQSLWQPYICWAGMRVSWKAQWPGAGV